MNWADYPNFTEDEFRCKCGCGSAEMDASFMRQLQMLRDMTGIPLTVSSGFRCPDYNWQVSKTGTDGPHTTGKAADIAIDREDAHTVLTAAFTLFPRIGVNQKGNKRFLHFDSLDTGATVWSY